MIYQEPDGSRLRAEATVKNNSGFSPHAISLETKPQLASHSVAVFNPALTCRETQSASGDSPLCLLTG